MTTHSRRCSSWIAFSVLVLVSACGAEQVSKPELDVGYDPGSRRILVQVTRPVASGERLHARVRKGAVGELDCARDAASIPRVDGQPFDAPGLPGSAYAGPEVDQSIFEPVYDDSWLELPEPTAEMLAQIADGEAFIDVCLVSDSGVVREGEFDIRRALDRTGANGKADGEEEVIASTEAYADKCVAELGDIPFFPSIGEGDYGTFNCLDATPLDTTVTGADGQVAKPGAEVDSCDNPQYIYSLCEGNAVTGTSNGPRVTSAANSQGTEWVLLCRKAKAEEGSYNDIAMIGHNPYTGKTCFFQNALYSRTDGLHVPHPGDVTESTDSPQQSASLWSGIHGGLGSGIQCASCHDADAFIHSPWIDQALNAGGDPVVPKMGIDEDFALGYADAPYTIVNSEGQGWTMPKVLVSPEAQACTNCHRIGDGRWSDDWIDRLVGEDESWNRKVTEAYREFTHAFWMPPDMDGLDAASWADSDFGKAVKFIQGCGRDPSSCQWAELPTEPFGEDGELPPIELEGEPLARAAAAVLGADVQDPSCPDGQCASRRCAECHSLSPAALRRWLDYTDHAWNECGLAGDPSAMSQDDARRSIDCLRTDPTDASSPFAAAQLGILAAGVQYGGFRTLFRTALGDEAWLAPYLQFKARVGMPKGSHPKLSQKEFATVQKWFADRLPALDDIILSPPAPTVCDAARDEVGIASHIDDMSFDGWSAVNREAGIRMFGCSGDDPLACFGGADFADRTSDWGNGADADAGSIRQLRELGFRTSFWTRSSADGRYIGNGGGSSLGSTITDLTTGTNIPVDASYDPGFFPDNSGFIFQGAVGGAGICPQSVLTRYDQIKFTEPECISATGINLYQHVARGVGGGDYFVINSQFVSDAGHGSADPRAFFDSGSTMKFTPMVFNGTTYAPMGPTVVDSPYEGDSVLSPSARLVVSRLAGADGQALGYVLRRVRATRFGQSYQVDIDQRLATICMPGAKANISFDERFLVTHHYHDGKSDILLYDLATGDEHQLTDVPVGTEARYPHFRSDGWIYFLVDSGDSETMAASDAAIRLSAAQ
ncbi:MAG TPA: hypothetical protein VK698_19080 [Kofleriaceae bacterium]|nr:hypothetical protein [Kofleriaceae bacterium]